jgi:hypothetical protein
MAPARAGTEPVEAKVIDGVTVYRYPVQQYFRPNWSRGGDVTSATRSVNSVNANTLVFQLDLVGDDPNNPTYDVSRQKLLDPTRLQSYYDYVKPTNEVTPGGGDPNSPGGQQ